MMMSHFFPFTPNFFLDWSQFKSQSGINRIVMFPRPYSSAPVRKLRNIKFVAISKQNWNKTNCFTKHVESFCGENNFIICWSKLSRPFDIAKKPFYFEIKEKNIFTKLLTSNTSVLRHFNSLWNVIWVGSRHLEIRLEITRVKSARGK